MKGEPEREYEAFETCPGVPTLTLRLADREQMLPYHGFAGGSFSGDRIELRFQDWKVEIEGRQLRDLWNALQLQDVRVIVEGPPLGKVEEDGADCVVSRIAMISREAW